MGAQGSRGKKGMGRGSREKGGDGGSKRMVSGKYAIEKEAKNEWVGAGNSRYERQED